MVALYFSMYREIAQVLDEFGHRNLALLKDKPLGEWLVVGGCGRN